MWNDRDVDVADIVETVKYLHEQVLDKITVANMREKLAYDERQRKFQGKYYPGDLVLMKNRSSGVFEPPLTGPYEFVRYKQGGRACWLKDNEGREFDCSVAHLVPFEIE